MGAGKVPDEVVNHPRPKLKERMTSPAHMCRQDRRSIFLSLDLNFVDHPINFLPAGLGKSPFLVISPTKHGFDLDPS